MNGEFVLASPKILAGLDAAVVRAPATEPSESEDDAELAAEDRSDNATNPSWQSNCFANKFKTSARTA